MGLLVSKALALLAMCATQSSVQDIVRSGLSASRAAVVSPVLNVHLNSGVRPSRELLQRIGSVYHVPIGVVRAVDQIDALCTAQVVVPENINTLGDAVSLLQKQMPTEEVNISGGVLYVRPKNIGRRTSAFLNTRIPTFNTLPMNHNAAGISLWFDVRSVLSPGETVAYAGSGSLSQDMIAVPPVHNMTLEQNLNLIVTLSGGGMWVWNSAISENRESTQVPYRVYGYVGDSENLNQSMRCPPKNQ